MNCNLLYQIVTHPNEACEQDAARGINKIFRKFSLYSSQMPSPTTPPLALTVPSLTVLQSRTSPQPNGRQADDAQQQRAAKDTPPPGVAGRGRLVDIVV
jgi:hypothetical protein